MTDLAFELVQGLGLMLLLVLQWQVRRNSERMRQLAEYNAQQVQVVLDDQRQSIYASRQLMKRLEAELDQEGAQ